MYRNLKNKISIVLFAFLLLSLTFSVNAYPKSDLNVKTTAYASKTAYLGDVDLDGKVTAMDSRIILRASTGDKLTAYRRKLADINLNGSIGADDARLALRMSVGMTNLKGFMLKDWNEVKDVAVSVLKVGDRRSFSVYFYPYNVPNKKIIWASTNSNVVKVDQNGHIIARKEGEATIIATSSYYNISATYKIIVNNKIRNVLSNAIEVSNYIDNNNYSYGHSDGKSIQGMEKQREVNCISFVTWVYCKAGYMDKIFTSCGQCLNDPDFQKKFRIVKDYEILQPGDIIFYGYHDHAEIYAGSGYTYNGGSMRYGNEPELRIGNNNLPYSSGCSFAYAYRLKNL